MDRKKEDRLTMFVLIQMYVLNLPAAVLASMPSFNSVFALFNSSVTAIRDLNEAQSAKGLGFRIEKDALKSRMIVNAVVISRAIKALALVTNNTVLAKDFGFNKSILDGFRDTLVADVCSFIQAKGLLLEADLVDYGITNAMLVELADDIGRYNDILSLPRQNIVDRKVINREIDNLFVTCDGQLKVMDALVTLLEETNEEVFVTYFNDRKIVTTGGRKLSIRGYVFDGDGSPIDGATVKIADGPSTKTTAGGYYEFKHLPDGVHKFIFECPGFAPVEEMIATMNGQRVNFNVTLESALGEAKES